MDGSANGSSGAAPSKPSKVETIKIASQYLRTFVAEEIANGQSHFTEDAATVLKFHGSYQQDDRDHRQPCEATRPSTVVHMRLLLLCRHSAGARHGQSLPARRVRRLSRPVPAPPDGGSRLLV